MNELLTAIDTVRALCSNSYGPSAKESLVFAPPDPPVITGDGHCILRAWRQRDENDCNPFERVILDAVEGVYREAGDGTTLFILLLHGVLRSVASRINDANRSAMQVQLARAFGQLRHQWSADRFGVLSSSAAVSLLVDVSRNSRGGFSIAAFVQDHGKRILKTALIGSLSHQVAERMAELVIQWVFSSSTWVGQEDPVLRLYQHLQVFLKAAPNMVIHAHSSASEYSNTIPSDEFILRKGLIPSQLPSILADTKPLRFVCLTGSVGLTRGGHQLVYELPGDGATDPWSSMRATVRRYVANLCDLYQVDLLISTERIEDDVASTCTALGIACVQYAEAKDVTSLCIRSGIYPLTTVFDIVDEDKHIGCCERGATVVRLSSTPSIRLRGITCKREDRKQQSTMVPQLVVHAPSKGVYTQYYNAILKSLRVLRATFTPDHVSMAPQHEIKLCRGAGHTEMQIARALKLQQHAMAQVGRGDEHIHMCMQAMMAALGESVALLRRNLSHTGGAGRQERQATCRVLEEMAGWSVTPTDPNTGTTLLDVNHSISTLLGDIQIPTVITGDPLEYNIVHPWHRTDTVIHAVLQTAEMLLKIDGVVRVKRNRNQENER